MDQDLTRLRDETLAAIAAASALPALNDVRVGRFTVLGGRPTGVTHEKLRELEHADFLDYSAVADAFFAAARCAPRLDVATARTAIS